MSSSPTPPADKVNESETLRDRAESRWRSIARESSGISGDVPIADIQLLVHELQVHQIELELQNAELRRAKDALDTSRARYVDLYDLAPVGYCSVSLEGVLVQANLTLATLLGVAPAALLHRPFSDFVLRQYQDTWHWLRKQLEQGQSTQTCEVRMHQGSISAVWVQLVASIAQDDKGNPLFHVVVSDISAMHRAKEALEESEMRWKFAIEGAGDGLWDWNIRTDRAFYSPRFKEMLGYTDLDIGTSVEEWSQRIHPDDVPGVVAALRLYLENGHGTLNLEYRMLCKDGSWRWTLSRCMVVERDDQGKPVRFIGANVDLTAQKKADENLHLAASVFSHAREGIFITDSQGTILDINQAFVRITGYGREEAIGRNPRFMSSGRQDAAFYSSMWRTLNEQGYWSGEMWNRNKDGEVYAELLTISSVCDTAGIAQQYVALFSDITDIKTHQNQLEHIAHFDALTNLPNRILLADRLQQAMTHAQRRGRMLAVAYLDMDGFKSINDKYGHGVGDQLLVALAGAMKDGLREGDTLARIGGDEFVAVMIDLESPTGCVPMLSRLVAAASEPVHLDGLLLSASASIGVTFYPQSGEVEADQLLRQADQAMYQAKVSGKNRYHVFDAVQDSSLRGHHESLERIRLALEQREFILHYQPKVNMRSGKVVGAEALIRWNHPEKGLLMPGTFLPVMEDHVLAVTVGEWVIDEALNQIARWKASGLDLPVSVNVGARQLQQTDFVDRLKSILAAHPQVEPTRLELEVLETSALADMVQVSQVIEACAAFGVLFVLDDFGTGYSSLTYLRRLKVKQLKIDQSFVHDMLNDVEDLAILEGVIGLAAAFKREVIAEGVETVPHGTLLLQLGCELAQGYGIARPMPSADFPAWVATWRPDSAWCMPHVQG